MGQSKPVYVSRSEGYLVSLAVSSTKESTLLFLDAIIFEIVENSIVDNIRDYGDVMYVRSGKETGRAQQNQNPPGQEFILVNSHRRSCGSCREDRLYHRGAMLNPSEVLIRTICAQVFTLYRLGKSGKTCAGYKDEYLQFCFAQYIICFSQIVCKLSANPWRYFYAKCIRREKCAKTCENRKNFKKDLKLDTLRFW